MPHSSHSSQNISSGAIGSAGSTHSGATLSSINNGGDTGGSAQITSHNSGSNNGPGSSASATTAVTTGSSSPGDDLGSTDEVKVFKDEGEQDEEISSQNLLEEKSSLIDLTESEVSTRFFFSFIFLFSYLDNPRDLLFCNSYEI